MILKKLKINGTIHINISLKEEGEEGNEIWNIPKDLGDFKLLALDTLNWSVGQKIKKVAGGAQLDLATVNSKAIAMIIKKLHSISDDTSMFTENEKSSWSSLLALANSGYSDSQKLSETLENLLIEVGGIGDISTNIMNASSHEEVIEILNSAI